MPDPRGERALCADIASRLQYRMSCQAVNIGSLEDVIKHFLTLAQDKAVEAQSVVDAQKGDLGGDLQAIANLEDADTAESIMLAAVGAAEDDEVRKQREGATPWIKFLWETYRTVLDILKNNAKLEVLYQDVAKRGFAFCKQYNRAKEFNRICDTLRTHLANLHRNQDRQQNRTIQISNLTNAPTVELFLDTRFEQLAVAMDLDMWQEAYRSVEDIHGLMSLSKKAPKPAMLAAYFRALTRIFFVSGAYLFHAFAWQKLYILTKNQKKDVSGEELKNMASCVLLAALCIPLNDTGSSIGGNDVDRDKELRMSALLGFAQRPTREGLIADLSSKSIVKEARSELKGLYSIMEKEFLPLQMMKTLKPVTDFLESSDGGEESLAQYVSPLRKVAVTGMLMQLSKVYKVMKIGALAKLTAPLSLEEVEMLIVDGMKNQLLSIRIDHQQKCLNFDERSVGAASIKDMLNGLSTSMHASVQLISPEKAGGNKQERSDVYAEILRNVPHEQKRVLSRKKLIEDRKEEEERIKEMEDAEATRMAEELAARRAAVEEKRVEDEAAARIKETAIQDEKDRAMMRKQEMIRELIESVRARPGRLSALVFLSVFLYKSILYGAFVWARRAPNRPLPVVSGPSCRRLFGPLFIYYCIRLLVPVLPY